MTRCWTLATAALLLLAPAATGHAGATRWTLAHARAYLVTHELDLVDGTQRDRPEFDVRLTRTSLAGLAPIGHQRGRRWSAFRFDGRAHDLLRDVEVHIRFVLRPTSTAPTVDLVRGPPPNRTQSAFPIRATFYYGWFPEAWDQEHVDPFTLYHPTLGFYDSGDRAVLREQIAAMRYARISTAIYSWWGQGSKTDSRFPLALALARQTPLRWAVYYEAEGYGDPSSAQIHADLLYLRAHYFSRPAYLHLGGRPVVFAYGDGAENCSVAQRWHDANEGIGAYLVLSAFGTREHVSFQPYGRSNSGGVRVAAGDVDGDGQPELIAAPGVGAPPVVKIFRRDATAVASFSAGNTQGVYAAAADLNGDGKAEVITGSDSDGVVHVFAVANGSAVEQVSFATGLAGTHVAAGNVNGDGRTEIVVGAASGPPVVKVFDAAGKELSSFAAAPQGQDGTTIAVGDVTGDGRADIVTGSGGVVRVFDTRGVEVYPSFTPYASYDGPVSVAVGDANHDGRADVITAGANGPEVQIFSTLGTSAQSFAEFDAFDATSSGPLSLAAADTNGNGAAEILAGVQPGYGGEVRLQIGRAHV